MSGSWSPRSGAIRNGPACRWQMDQRILLLLGQSLNKPGGSLTPRPSKIAPARRIVRFNAIHSIPSQDQQGNRLPGQRKIHM